MLNLEQLESRLVPTTSIRFGNVLTVYGDVAHPNNMLAETAPGGVNVTVNGQTNLYAGLDHLVLIGGDANDVVINRSNIPGSIFGQGGNDVIRVFSGNDFIVAGTGNDDVQALLGTNFVYVNEDADTDFVTASPTSFVSAAPNDIVIKNGRQYLLSGDTLYLISDSGFNTFIAFNNGNDGVAVLYGSQNYYLSATGIKHLVFVGSNANDAFINVSTIDAIVFGGGGDDIYLGNLTKTQFTDAIEFVFAV